MLLKIFQNTSRFSPVNVFSIAFQFLEESETSEKQRSSCSNEIFSCKYVIKKAFQQLKIIFHCNLKRN